jgi:hypothetical protein
MGDDFLLANHGYTVSFDADPFPFPAEKSRTPRNWAVLCDQVTDNFRVIKPKDFRVVT